jgi:hypothetical protein
MARVLSYACAVGFTLVGRPFDETAVAWIARVTGSFWACSAARSVREWARHVGVHGMTWRSCQVGMATFVSTFIPPIWEPCSSAACR